MYKFKYLDVINDSYFFSGDAAEEKLTLSTMPLYAFFTQHENEVLPVRCDTINMLLTLDNETLWAAGLCKSDLLAARNAFIEFERAEELFPVDFYGATPYELFAGFSDDEPEPEAA